jgi:hypothetical protein
MDERQTHPSWPIAMAVSGLALIGLEATLVAPKSAMLAIERFDRSFWSVEATIMQAVLVCAVVGGLGLALAFRSRLAYIVALLVGVAPAAAWLYLVAMGDPIAFDRAVVRAAAASLLVLTGLAFALPSFRRLQREPGQSVDGARERPTVRSSRPRR